LGRISIKVVFYSSFQFQPGSRTTLTIEISRIPHTRSHRCSDDHLTTYRVFGPRTSKCHEICPPHQTSAELDHGRSSRRQNSQVEGVINPKIAAHDPLPPGSFRHSQLQIFLALDLDFPPIVLFADPSEAKGDTKRGD
jgi:hypothetical protein